VLALKGSAGRGAAFNPPTASRSQSKHFGPAKRLWTPSLLPTTGLNRACLFHTITIVTIVTTETSTGTAF
jgi:hypothetical protein